MESDSRMENGGDKLPVYNAYVQFTKPVKNAPAIAFLGSSEFTPKCRDLIEVLSDPIFMQHEDWFTFLSPTERERMVACIQAEGYCRLAIDLADSEQDEGNLRFRPGTRPRIKVVG